MPRSSSARCVPEASRSLPFASADFRGLTDEARPFPQIHTISEAPSLPFVFEDASRADAEFAREDATFARVELNTRLQARTFDLRTPANNAIFRIQHGVSKLFREFLENKDFVEIHSPKLQGAATESGASVFKVDYFKRVL